METEKFTGISSFFSAIQNNYEFEFASKKDFYCKLTVVVYILIECEKKPKCIELSIPCVAGPKVLSFILVFKFSSLILFFKSRNN